MLKRSNRTIHREYCMRPYRRNRYDYKGPFRFIKGLLLAIVYLISFVVLFFIAYLILIASQEKELWQSLVLSGSIFSMFGIVFIDSRDALEWQNRWAIMFRHIQYEKIMAPKKRKADAIGGLMMMGVFGLESIYSIVKLIIFYFIH